MELLVARYPPNIKACFSIVLLVAGTLPPYLVLILDTSPLGWATLSTNIVNFVFIFFVCKVS